MTVTLSFKWLSSLIMKEEGKISISKFLIWLTGILGLISFTNSELVAAGIIIPSKIVPYIKDAAVLSGIITGLRLRWNMTPLAMTVGTSVSPAASTTVVPPATTETK